MASTTRVMGQRMEDESVLASLPSWQYGCGRGLIMATATVHARPMQLV
jgi:hypothetical protein